MEIVSFVILLNYSFEIFDLGVNYFSLCRIIEYYQTTRRPRVENPCVTRTGDLGKLDRRCHNIFQV
jgi:hypothetical protein